MIIIYGICVLFLLAVGMLFGWSYVDASVYICEYFAPALGMLVCFITFIMGIIFFIKQKFNGKWILTIVLQIFNLIAFAYSYNVLTTKIENYAGMSNKEIFDKVVYQLRCLAADNHTDYFTVNVLVYVVPFLIICLFWFFQYLLNRSRRKTKKTVNPNEKIVYMPNPCNEQGVNK